MTAEAFELCARFRALIEQRAAESPEAADAIRRELQAIFRETASWEHLERRNRGRRPEAPSPSLMTQARAVCRREPHATRPGHRRVRRRGPPSDDDGAGPAAIDLAELCTDALWRLLLSDRGRVRSADEIPVPAGNASTSRRPSPISRAAGLIRESATGRLIVHRDSSAGAAA